MGSAAFFLAVPAVVGIVVPWWLGTTVTRWVLPDWAGLRWLGGAAVVVGVIGLVACFVDFVRARGTPAPIAPTDRLVVTGLYRYVRNPMYVAVFMMIVGQALWHASGVVLAYGVAAWATTAVFVRWYEEPTLADQFGPAYDEYRQSVPAWIPRLTPWQPPTGRNLGG